MEKTNNTPNEMKENIDRSRNNPKNSIIYKYLKEEELARLTDEEFEILQKKISLPHLTTATLTAYFYDFHVGYEANDFKPSGLKGDETTLNVFKRIIAAHHSYFPCFYKYSRVFSFCRALGVANLYDIGCGNQLQAALLIYAPEMNYTGIDPHIFQDYPDNFFPDPAYINELFEQFADSDRIRYIKETYPFNLTVAENNIAISTDSPIGRAVGDEKMKNVVAALPRDFERVVLTVPFQEVNLTGMNIKDIVYNEVEVWRNPFEKYYDLWKNAMPDFEFYRIGERNYIFGTKIAEDREKLKKKYTLIDDRIMAGVVDIPWHTTLLY